MNDVPATLTPEIVEEADIHALVVQGHDHGWFQPGEFYDSIPNEVYHAGPGCSSTNLKRTLRSPLHDHTEKAHPKRQTEAMRIGTLFHALVLEPELFEKTYVPMPKDAPKRPTETQLKAKKLTDATKRASLYWGRWDVKNEGKQIISTKPGKDEFWDPSDWDRIHYMRDAVHNHPIASCFLQSFIPERSMYWREPIDVRFFEDDGQTVKKETKIYELAKCRYDGICRTHDIGFDLKSTDDATYSGFTRSIVKFGYHVSRNWYMRGAAATKHTIKEFIFITVEKVPPYAVGCYTVHQDFIYQADMLIQQALENYSRAIDEQYWPSYHDGCRELALPPYAKFIPIS